LHFEIDGDSLLIDDFESFKDFDLDGVCGIIDDILRGWETLEGVGDRRSVSKMGVQGVDTDDFGAVEDFNFEAIGTFDVET
jgi:hypothetical protein